MNVNVYLLERSLFRLKLNIFPPMTVSWLINVQGSGLINVQGSELADGHVQNMVTAERRRCERPSRIRRVDKSVVLRTGAEVRERTCESSRGAEVQTVFPPTA